MKSKKFFKSLLASLLCVTTMMSMCVSVSAAGTTADTDEIDDVLSEYTIKTSDDNFIVAEKDGDTYMFDADTFEPLEGLVYVNGVTRAFYASGQMVTSDWYFDFETDDTYYFNKEGKPLSDGIYSVNGAVYCFDKWGVMQTGLVTKNGKYYYFKKSNGKRAEGFVKINNDTYCFNKETGEMYAGWVGKGGEKYYFLSNGKMAKSTTLYINDIKCVFDANGCLQ